MLEKNIYVTRSAMPPYEEFCEAIKPLWESRWLTNMGRYHQSLEEKLKEYLEVPELSLMVNGHMALELAIQAFDFPEWAEVITTPFTFISTTHAIVRNRLIPVFCDVKEDDGTIDPEQIENLITEKTVAILPVHVYGNVCDVDAIQSIADKYGLKVIYDAAHAFGVKYQGKGIANYGDAAVFSFHATKLFHTLEGGAVASKEYQIYERLYNLKNFGIRDEELVVSIGANAKMNEFAAVMGLCNMNYLADEIVGRKACHEYYTNQLNGMEGVRFIGNSGEDRNYGYFPIECRSKELRDRIYSSLRRENIYGRKYFYPLTADQACFSKKYESAHLPVARKLADRVIVLPMYNGLTQEDMDRIIKIIKNEAIV